MKTKTTLAALLLAAVMVTPSYGASLIWLKGAEHNWRGGKNEDSNYWLGFFEGYVHRLIVDDVANGPPGSTCDELYTVVARYVFMHPEQHWVNEAELVKRALKEAWPDLNKHVVISK